MTVEFSPGESRDESWEDRRSLASMIFISPFRGNRQSLGSVLSALDSVIDDIGELRPSWLAMDEEAMGCVTVAVSPVRCFFDHHPCLPSHGGHGRQPRRTQPVL